MRFLAVVTEVVALGLLFFAVVELTSSPAPSSTPTPARDALDYESPVSTEVY